MVETTPYKGREAQCCINISARGDSYLQVEVVVLNFSYLDVRLLRLLSSDFLSMR